MQKVACPMTIVHNDRLIPLATKNELSAMPVMMPGSASGSTTTNETTSRPKNRKRCTAKAAADPSSTAIAVETSAALRDNPSELATSELCTVAPNHLSVKPAMGQLWMCDELKA